MVDDDLVLGRLLYRVCHLHHREAERVFELMGLHRGQPPLLRLLWDRDGRTHSELAQGMSVQPATISRMLKRMERRGFILRQQDRRDERVSRVYLTQKGRAVQEAVFGGLRALDIKTFGGLSASDRRSLFRILERVRGNLLEGNTGREHRG
jgi:DNA-binding MarR family transcriptional regulator